VAESRTRPSGGRWPYRLGPFTLYGGWAVVGPSGLHVAVVPTKRQALAVARAMRESGLRAGQRVRCWPGSRTGGSYLATTIADCSVWSDSRTPVIRVEKDAGGTDYLALTHVAREHDPDAPDSAAGAGR
jgi:hypothetical protein